MANSDHFRILKQGVPSWNKWRQQYPFVRPDLREADCHGMELQKIDFLRILLSHADLSNTDLSGADMRGTDLSNANLQNAQIHHTILGSACLEKTNFSGAELFYTILEAAHGQNPCFHHAFLRETSLTMALLHNAQFTEARLISIDFTDASLDAASFENALLRHVNWTDAHFPSANFHRARFDYTIFESTNLDNARFSQAHMGWTTWNAVRLHTIVDLTTIHHFAPSEISYSTILQSQEQLPIVFLRNAGVPDSLLQRLSFPLLTLSHHEIPLTFIIHAPEDQEFVSQLFHNLQRQGLRCWLSALEEDVDFMIQKLAYTSHTPPILLLTIFSQHTVLLRQKDVTLPGDEEEVAPFGEDESQLISFLKVLLQQEKMSEEIQARCLVLGIDEQGSQKGQLFIQDEARHGYLDFQHWKNPTTYNQTFDQLMKTVIQLSRQYK